MLTPGGAFKVPDQITVLNKFETVAHTKVYQSEAEQAQDLAWHAGGAISARYEDFNVTLLD